MNIFTEYEMKLLNEANIYIENKEKYTLEEKKKISTRVMDLIMNQSSKNKMIDNMRSKYETILEKSR